MAESNHDFVAQAIAGGAAILATIGAAVGGVKVGARRGGEERRENDSVIRRDVEEIKEAIKEMRAEFRLGLRETHNRIDQLYSHGDHGK